MQNMLLRPSLLVLGLALVLAPALTDGPQVGWQAAVPEPRVLLAIATGALLVGALMWRR